MSTLVADLETDGYLDAVSKIWCLGVFDIDANVYTEYSDYRPGAPTLREGLEKLRAADVVVGHNFLGYDTHVIDKLYSEFSLDVRKIRDTLVMSRLYNPSRKGGHNLDILGEQLFKAPKHPSPDFSRYSDAMSEYLKQDLRITVRLWKWLSRELSTWGYSVELEHLFAYIMSLQMINGFGFDETAARALLVDLSDEKVKLEEALKHQFPPVFVPTGEFTPKKDDAKRGYVAGGPFTKVDYQEFNPSSRQVIASRLSRKYGWKPKSYTQTGQPEISEETLAELDFPEAKLIGRFLRIEKMLGMLDGEVRRDGSGGGWLKHVKNGRIHGYVNSNGAVTGRCTHSKPNVAQADSDPRMRSLWVPRRGWKLAGSDAEGIELRGLGHYLAPYDGGAFSNSVANGDKSKGTDAHSINRDILGMFNRGGTGVVGAKNYIYALIYGAGDAKLGELIIQDAIDAGKYNKTDAPHLFSVKQIRFNGGNRRVERVVYDPIKHGHDTPVTPRSKSDLGKESRAKIETGLTGFGALVRKVKHAANTRGYLIGIDGRRLWVRSPHSALNTLLQSFGAVIMKEALVKFHFADPQAYGVGFAYCANVHDEVQIEAHPSCADAIGQEFVRQIEAAGLTFKVRCPLAGTYVVGDNWSQTH